jgi:hypothetical protein
MRVHRVCVAIGAAEQSQAETGKRTLTVSAIVADGSERFTIGRVRSAHGMFHVFDDHTLPIVLSELSTTADFLDYLRKKETLFESDRFAFAESELDLLGYFLWNNREFPALGAEKFKLNPNLWQQVESDAAFLAARKENEISFFWDGLIERLTELWMKEQLAYGNEIPVTDHERLLRTFAAETRFSRRLLQSGFLNVLRQRRVATSVAIFLLCKTESFTSC